MKTVSPNSKDSNKPGAKPAKVVVQILLCIGCFIALTFAVVYSVEWSYQKKVACCYCPLAGSANLIGAISDYYSNPENIDFPTLETLIEEYSYIFCDNSYQHTYTIEQIPSGNEIIKITVILNENCNCPDGDKLIRYMGDLDEADLPIEEEGWHYLER